MPTFRQRAGSTRVNRRVNWACRCRWVPPTRWRLRPLRRLLWFVPDRY